MPKTIPFFLRSTALVLLFSLFLSGFSFYPLSANDHVKGFPAGKGVMWMENKGQVRDFEGNSHLDILFFAQSGTMKLALNATGIQYQFEQMDGNEIHPGEDNKVFRPESFSVNTYRVDVQLVGANANPEIIAENPQDYYENYYNIPGYPNGIERVQAFQRIRLKNVYPQIDWVIYFTENGLKYDFEVHPGGNPALIQLKYAGATALQLLENGGLQLETPLGKISENAPYTYSGSGKRTEIQSAFRLKGQTLSFEVGDYAANELLVIDPVLSWATYYGGQGNDRGYSTVYDKLGNVYLAGYTSSTTAISAGGHQNTFAGGSFDGLLVKFNAAGVRQWSTYYGGTGSDQGFSARVDTSNNVFLAGTTGSTTGIAAAGFQNTFGGGSSDGFLIKFNAAGIRQWGTYSGANPSEVCLAMDLHSNGNMALGGSSGSDAFLAHYSAAGALLWRNIYGGSGSDDGNSVSFDGSGNLYLAGATSSTSGVASGGFQNVFGGDFWDGFLIKANPAGTMLWATYYGGSAYDQATSVVTDAAKNVYLAGKTNSTAAIASGGHQNAFGGGTFDGFLVKFDSAGARIWSTYYGGSSNEDNIFVARDPNQQVYIGGNSLSSAGIGTAGGYQPSKAGVSDAFLAKFTPAGTRTWGTYYGGPDNDYAHDAAIDAVGTVYLTGHTRSTSGIASGGHQNTFSAFDDGFLAKIFDGCLTPPAAICQNISVNINSGPVSITANQIDNGSASGCGNAVSLSIPPSTFDCNTAGPNTVTLTVTDAVNGLTSTCNAIVTAIESTPPVAVCNDLTLYLDGSGQAAVTPMMVNNGSSDNCGIDTVYVDSTLFNCSSLVSGGSSITELFFSEYMEGTANNKCVEIYNGTGAPVNLGATGYAIRIYYNGASTYTSFPLTGTVAAGDVYVYCHTTSLPATLAQADQTTQVAIWTGDDAVVLVKGTQILDIIGRIGEDPGSAWTASGLKTINQTLVRNANVTSGVFVNPASGFPTLDVEWTNLPLDDVSNLGQHTTNIVLPSLTLTVVDASGNMATCTANYTLADTSKPSISCQNPTVYLNSSSQATLTPGMVSAAISDNCGIASTSLSRTQFDCLDVASGGNTPTELFISEYMEGNSNNKCVEIYNGTAGAIDLGVIGYALRIYYNGSVSFTTLPLSGIVASGDVFVFCHSTSLPATLAQADQTTPVAIWTGDDAIALVKGSQILDIFGRIGEDPGSGWSIGGIKTINQTLVRKQNVYQGITINPSANFPTLATEWNQLGIDDISNLGTHTILQSGVSAVATLTVLDNNGNASYCTVNVAVLDTFGNCRIAGKAVSAAENNETTAQHALRTTENHDAQLAVFPNPFRESVTFRFELQEEMDAELIISDLSGHIIHQQVVSGTGTQEMVWKSGEIPAGMYVYRLQIGTEAHFGRVNHTK